MTEVVFAVLAVAHVFPFEVTASAAGHKEQSVSVYWWAVREHIPAPFFTDTCHEIHVCLGQDTWKILAGQEKLDTDLKPPTT